MLTCTLDWQMARDTCIAALRCHDLSLDDARLQADLLLEAELRGRPSHGLMRLPRVLDRIRNGVAVPGEKGKQTWHGNALLQVDGAQGLGPVVACAALDAICERARRSGVAVAAIQGSNHIGMLAFYAERVAARGQVLIALSTSEALVHPWGGRRALLGTNPVAIGVPAQPWPFVMDMATGLISMGQVHDYASRQWPLQPGWALDAAGSPTLDAQAAKAGAIAPFGEAKGYALGLAFEVLVTSVTASALGTDVHGTLDTTQACNKGDVFIVIEPASNHMAERITAYLDEIRACPPIQIDGQVSVPGDRALRQRAASMRDGIQLSPVVWETIRQAAQAAKSISN